MSDDHAGPALDPDDLDISKSEYVRALGEDRYVVSAGAGPPRVPPDGESGGKEGNPDGERDGQYSPDDPAESEAQAGTAADARPARAPDRPAEGADSATGPAASGEAGGGSPKTPPKPNATPREGVPRGAPSRDGNSVDETSARGGTRPAAEVDAAAVGRYLAASLAGTEFAYGFDATLSIEDETVRHRMVSNDVATTFETLALWFARSAAGGDVAPERALGILLAEMDAGVTLPAAALERAVARHDLSAEDSIGELLAAAERANGLTLE